MPKRQAKPVQREYAPLSAGWFITSILGMLISIMYVSKFSVPWAAAFTVVFACMFFAGMMSMRRAAPDSQLLPRPKRLK